MSGRTVINNRYELEEQPIATGGMGEVWGGRDIKLDREVAVKFVRFPEGTPDQDLIRRFVRESRITARLEHPGVPAIYDVGTHDERPYLVMQRIHGISVADLIAEQGQLSIGWATAIAAQTCAVLSVAHRASLLHRDLKPNNLILEGDGSVKAHLLLALVEKKPEDRPASAEVVYHQLLPLTTHLQLLPGVLNPPTMPSPLRMYASVLSRVHGSATAAASGSVPPPGPPPAREPSADAESSRLRCRR